MSDFRTTDFVRIKYVSDEDTLLTSVKATSKMNLFLYKGPIMEKSVSYFFDGENKGVLKITSFQPKTISFYKKEVANFFQEVTKRNCSEIVIDLRDNQGGYVKAQEYLMSYLNFNKKQYVVQHVYKRSYFDPFVKLPYFKRKRFMHRAKREYPYGILSQEYDFMRSDLGSVAKIPYSDVPQNEFGLTFNGKCTLVTNGLSMSASVLFASWFRNVKRGEIIGSPCLGPMSGTFGTSVSLNLPSTGLPIMISTVKFNPQYANEAEFEPILPDKLLEYSVKDILLSRDPIWNYLNIRRDENQSLK
jgi:C-terminal processing protease CtpA/Prc